MFNLFKRIRAASVPVLVIAGKIKYNEDTKTYFFYPHYAKTNGLQNSYNVGSFPKHPCKFKNATSIGFFNLLTRRLISFTDGRNGTTIHMIDE